MPIEYAWGPRPEGGNMWRFRLWAPDCDTVFLRLSGHDIAMQPEDDGWFITRAEAHEGTQYAFVLPGGQVGPDPASRRQMGGVHGPSCLIHPRIPRRWAGRPWEETVICELHVGTFTEEGTFRAAIADLPRLAETGFTAIELMPIAQFGGDRGWGYDGVLPYAPHEAYGTPADLAALVDAAHDNGMSILLDVVYNHFGPEGNFLPLYASDFFDTARHTPWGAGIDYTRPAVRRLFIENAIYWLEEFGFDGLRLDAIDQIVDPSEPDLLVELAREVRQRQPGGAIHLTTEDNRNVTHLHERGRAGAVVLYSGEWNDDFHNAAHVLATGESDGYYKAFADDPIGHLGRALAEGFAYQGAEGRGEPSAHLRPTAFVDFLQNHDQAGNRALGERLIGLTDADTLEALTAILTLSPHIPLFFMGEDYGETRPFPFFAHFGGDLDRAVREGRQAEFAEFAAFADAAVPDPVAEDTFLAAKLDPRRRDSPEGRAHAARLKRLLRIRRERIVPLLFHAAGHAGRVIAAADGQLAVDWTLGDATLSLRARFGAETLPPLGGGEVIHHACGPDAKAEAVLSLGPAR